MVSLSNMQREITILSEGIFEIASILKRNYGCNDPNFRKTFSDILIQSGNKNLNIIINSIVDSIVTELWHFYKKATAKTVALKIL